MIITDAIIQNGIHLDQGFNSSMILKNKQFKMMLKNVSRLARLIIAQSIAAALWLLLIPGDEANALILGYSSRRLALLLPPIVLACAAGLVADLLRKRPAWQVYLTDDARRASLAHGMVVTGALLSSAMLALFTFYHYILRFPDVGAFFRLLPLMLLFFLTGIELILFVPLVLFKSEKKDTPRVNALWRSRALWIALAVLLAVLALIEITDLGKQPVRVSIITLGVPLLEGQVWFTAGSLALLLLCKLAWSSIPSRPRNLSRRHFDLLIFFLIWLVAFAFWMRFPLPEHNYFAPAVRPPTFEKYPFSDAEYYDYNALYVLFGALEGFVVSKPLYVSFLTILHFLVGYDYGRVVLLQTALVALLPAVGYLIGKELHSRLAGGGLALLLILREANAILASTMANVSNSKLLMSDVPATLIVAVMVLVTICWCKADKNRLTHHVFLLGGLTAMLNLTRIQTLALIPFFLVLIIIRSFKRWKQALLGIGIFLLTVSLLLAPILIRNHAITGVYWLDNPASSSALYSFILKGSNIDLEVEQAETSEQVLDRNFTVIFTAMRENLGQMVAFIFENFSRNIISTILILPLRLGNNIPFEDMLRMASPFFMEVYSQPGLLNLAVLLVNLCVIAVGFAAVWRKQPLAAAMVVLTYLAYNASSSAVRLSGWRFIQPVDWIMLIFFVAGLIELIVALLRSLSRRDFAYQFADNAEPQPRKNTLVPNLIAGVAFFIACAFIPLREGLLPPTYPPYDPQAVCAEMRDIVAADQTQIPAQDVYDFCLADSTRVLKGYGFYPRFFKAYEGYYDRVNDQYFGRQNYARLVFRLAGKRRGKIYIKTNQPDIRFRDGDLVYALVYDRPKADAQLVIVGESEPVVIYADPILGGELTFSDLR
jgi:hypothetical protein